MTESKTETSKDSNKLRSAKHIAVVNGIGLKKVHAKRLRDMYRSAGWPCLDVVEIELLAAGLLERLQEEGGHERMRVTDVGIQFLALAANSNRQAKDPHEALVEKVAHDMLKEGRLVWTRSGLKAMSAFSTETTATTGPCGQVRLSIATENPITSSFHCSQKHHGLRKNHSAFYSHRHC